jgi:hypothetical protein
MCKTLGELISIDALTDSIDSSSTLSDYIGDDLQPTATALEVFAGHSNVPGYKR